MTLHVVIALATICGNPAAGVASEQAGTGTSVVVEAVATGSAGEKTGLQTGDVLTSWTREGAPPVDPAVAQGVLASSCDLLDLEVEQGARGPLVLRGTRRRQPLAIEVSHSPWGITVVPSMAASTAALHAMARRQSTSGDLTSAVVSWRKAADAPVTAISRLFGRRATVHLGADATEARAKQVTNTRFLHFATHGLLDDRFPLNSALALTMPARSEVGENGLLQTWEIFEQVRLDVDLVTLSACETALGIEATGEGLLGLVRAFHYAGARSVLGSLWSVADRSTADLMADVYRHLNDGVAKDEALRRAQRAALQNPETSHPFHWAGFTLSGLWR